MVMESVSNLSLAILLSVFLRWCVSIHEYSGYNSPPMFGDYEAQRHWMEITLNLPSKEWYCNSTDNDLMYWGLDYPPLTAYHSLLCGHISKMVDPNSMVLNISRGYESHAHKLFMRSTVLIADLLVYYPSILWFFNSRKLQQRSSKCRYKVPPTLAMYLSLLYPGLILIDHGHFQYNNISLGLTIAAVAALFRGKELIGSVLFTLSVNYKQMELYHALPFFCYLLGICLPSKNQSALRSVGRLACIGGTVMVTFLLTWLPFLGSLDDVSHVLNRLFPLARGVFEDKVANFWCSANVVFKLRDTFSNSTLALLCLAVTSIAILPSCFNLLRRPTLDGFVVALINSSLAFFLFSFQVHEKSILLVAIPIVLYFLKDPFHSLWFVIVSTFSMLPLLIKDGLVIPSVALTVIYFIAVTLTIKLNLKMSFFYHLNTFKRYLKATGARKPIGTGEPIVPWVNLGMFFLSIAGCVVLTIASLVVNPPARYPDLLPLLVSSYSCAHFLMFFVYFNYIQLVGNNDV